MRSLPTLRKTWRKFMNRYKSEQFGPPEMLCFFQNIFSISFFPIEQEIYLMANNKLAEIYRLSDGILDYLNISYSKKRAIRNAKDCGTGKTGVVEFSSGDETRLVPHTCKSRACP